MPTDPDRVLVNGLPTVSPDRLRPAGGEDSNREREDRRLPSRGRLLSRTPFMAGIRLTMIATKSSAMLRHGVVSDCRRE